MSITQDDIDSLLSAATDLEAETSAPAPSVPVPAPAASAARPASPSRLSRTASGELQRILRLRVPVIVKLAERDRPVSSILKLTAGSILEFERHADAALDLLINNKIVGEGQAVKVGENFGLRITRMYNVQNIINALGE